MATLTQPGMDKCGDNVDTKFCYEPHGDRGYVVYNDYKPCMESWILLPGFELLPREFVATVYFFFLVYLFLGISILSDVFMNAIEVITAKKRTLKRIDAKTQQSVEVEVDVWNATVANLTLLALGSSAPEILLSLIETMTTLGSCDSQNPGELGAATIVGSASFNLLAISAVCMVSVPDGEVRKITEFSVFLTTAVFSLFAYIWVFFVYEWSSKEVIDLWEALITLGLFPCLIIAAYGVDRGWFSFGTKVGDVESGKQDKLERVMDMHVAGQTVDHHRIAAIMKSQQEHLADEDSKRVFGKNLMTEMFPIPVMTRMRHRINAARMLAGKKFRTFSSSVGLPTEPKSPLGRPSLSISGSAMTKETIARLRGLDGATMLKEMADVQFTCFAFRSRAYTVLENAGIMAVAVHRGGPLDFPTKVRYRTIPGTATPQEDYIHIEGELDFPAGTDSLTINVEIVNDDQYEPDENFFIELFEPDGEACILHPQAEITIIDDDEPGMLVFAKSNVSVLETALFIEVEVKRIRGASGKVSVSYITEDMSAFAGQDYDAAKGELTFEHNEVSKRIRIGIIDDDVPEVNKQFKVRLYLPKGGAAISKRPECEITIIDDDDVNVMVEQITNMLQERNELFAVGSSSWAKQFKEAMVPAGASDGIDDEEIGASEYVLHYLCITWKLLAACIPPTDIWDGWATFYASLALNGFVTALVGQVATLFGCACGLKDAVTAISFVALGTSLPDTFASKMATIESSDADSAIGNVTGSNSVNVFLGLGLPWTLAALYYEVGLGCKYEVKAGALAFSVMIFMVFAVVCLLVIILRRFFGPGELGGGSFGKKATAAFFLFLWFLYVMLSSLQAYGHISFGEAAKPSPPPPLKNVLNPRMIP